VVPPTDEAWPGQAAAHVLTPVLTWTELLSAPARAAVAGAVRRDRVIAHLTEAVTGLTPAAAAQTLDRVAAVRGLTELDRYLQAHPDALNSPGPAPPLSLVRLAHALRKAGHTEVTLPACVECARPAADLRHRNPRGRICQVCQRRASTVATPCGPTPDGRCYPASGPQPPSPSTPPATPAGRSAPPCTG